MHENCFEGLEGMIFDKIVFFFFFFADSTSNYPTSSPNLRYYPLRYKPLFLKKVVFPAGTKEKLLDCCN